MNTAMTTGEAIARYDLNFPFDLPKHLALAAAFRQDSMYMMEASGANEGEETAIDTCDRKLKRISNVMVWDNLLNRYVMKQTRYLKGCPTIWVDEQKAMNWEIQNEAASAIFLISGGLAFGVEGDNVQKAMFLMLHENNTSFGEVEGKFKRPEGSADVFFVIEEEVKAEKLVEAFFMYETEAKKYLSQLLVQGKDGIVYHEDRLRFLAELFQIPAFDSGLGAETFAALLEKVNEDPKKFMTKVGKYESVVEGDVRKAIAAGVIQLNESGASFTDGGKLIVTFDKVRMSDSERVKEVIDVMLNPSNTKLYEHLRSLTVMGLKSSAGIIEE